MLGKRRGRRAVWGTLSLAASRVVGTLLVASVLLASDRAAISSSAAGAELEDPPRRCAALNADVDRSVELLKKSAEKGTSALEGLLAESLAIPCVREEVRIRSMLGRAYRLANRWTDSLDCLVKGWQAANRLSAGNDSPSAWQPESKLQQNFSALLIPLGLPELALDRLRRAHVLLDKLEEIPDPATTEDTASVRADTFLQMARAQRMLEDPEAARDSIDRGLRAARKKQTRVSLEMELARLFIHVERFEDAEAALERALRTAGEQPGWQAAVLTDFADLEVHRGQWVEAVNTANRGLELLTKIESPSPITRSHSLYVKSVALNELGLIHEARQAADKALTVLATLSESWADIGLHFFDLGDKYYRHRLDVAAGSRDVHDVWATLQRIHARTFTLGLGRATPEASSHELIEALQQLDRLEPDTAPQAKVFRETVFRSQRLKQLQINQLALGGAAAAPSLSPEAAARRLEAGTLALHFAAGKKAIYVLSLDDQGNLSLSTLPANLDDIQERVRDVAKLLKTGPQQDEALRDDLAWLGDALLRPIAERLEQADRLILVADASLIRLPFGLLIHPRTGRRLIESHETSYVPSLSVLAFLRDRTPSCTRPQRHLLAVGDPIFGQHEADWPEGLGSPRANNEDFLLTRLRDSGEEVRRLAELYSEDAATLLLRRDATRRLLLDEAPRHGIVHIASHATSDLEVAERSKIALSCLGPDGRVEASCDLYVAELSSLELCGQLVVLSACSSAEGPAVFGEGILGLPRAFLRAGASTVIASRWDVTDGPTAELMTAFHRHLRRGHGPAAALRHAKLERIAEGVQASDWAAFVVLGDNKSSPAFNLSVGVGSHESNGGSQDP
ncbi:MAG: CHAT domain-containing tetratricopeptide repeat protein [Acidobacteriota bacterium]